MTQSVVRPSQTVPDQKALAQVGAKVRERLAANRAVQKLPTDKAEIYALGDFMTPMECRHMISLVESVAKPSPTFDIDGSSYRTSYSGDVYPWDPFIMEIQRRIDDVLGMDPEFGETIQGQRYMPGQEFKSHCDWFNPDGDYWKAQSERGGQRCYTAMVFLNDVEEGGTTDFTAIGLSVEPKAGALLMWNNASEDGSPNRWTLHAGTPVKKGVKYVITKWYRTRRWG